MSLYIGCNYHPHDWPEERYETDIKLMKEAHFTTVRLGHLCWDSFEPEEGVYTFQWFDRVMDLFAEAGIGVMLDLSTRPAPVWVHKKCPGCEIYGPSGTRQASLTRYMEDVTDPDYQRYSLEFVEKLIIRYRSHPALFAFGLCNELGAGYLSHSPAFRGRFIGWLAKEYENDIGKLNHAWQTQRWSRKLTCFEEIEIPDNELTVGSPESWLDLKRFVSEGTIGWLETLAKTVEELAPGIPHSSNHYADHPRMGFDYLKGYPRFIDVPGVGYYPDFKIDEWFFRKESGVIRRLAETGKPLWCLEYQSGRNGICCAPKGFTHMLAMHSLIAGTQMILGWTWRTMLGGEEQYHYGLLGHDGLPSPNYRDYSRIAADFEKLQEYAFPYLPEPDTAVAYSYDSSIMCAYEPGQYRQTYEQAMAEVYHVFYQRNRDYRMVDLTNRKGQYRLILIPNHCLMEDAAIQQVRDYVAAGGTVIMTGYSAILDGTGTAFSTPRPGKLDDVFGIRVAAFYRTDMTEEKMGLQLPDKELPLAIEYYEELELITARPYVMFSDGARPAVTVHAYGKGKAYYMATESNRDLLGWLIDSLTEELGLKKGLEVPEGVQAREIADGQRFYVNMTKNEVIVPISEPGRGILTGRTFYDTLILKGYESELIVAQKQEVI